MENLAKFFKHDFKNGYFELFDKNGNGIYYESLDESWIKKEYDENNNMIYFKNSDDFWIKKEYDGDSNEIYCENLNDFWIKREFDKDGNKIYYEDSNGFIEDNRPTCAGKVVEIDGKKYKLKEI